MIIPDFLKWLYKVLKNQPSLNHPVPVKNFQACINVNR